ncbi:MAG: P-II family nitrogen regulator [Candidatus Margulisbacteria bacterium]|jgi:nitrogen regulatory protein P-II 1|nr:P-II family nitrogen regulator [Candidatus Margulisiibacteriota bacterium]
MKKIEAIIRSEKLDDLREKLDASGYTAMTVTEVKGRGAQKGILLEWRVGEYRVEFIPKVKVELVVNAETVDKVIEIILSVCSSGKVGDGKIFISSVEEVVRIRTGERGQKAL